MGNQHLVHRPHRRKQGEEQHGEGGGHDQVRHVDDRLEELLTLDVQPVAGEEHRQQQGHHDLGHGAHDPEDQGVAEVFDHADGAALVWREELHIVLQPHKVWADLGQTVPVVFEEAVVDGHDLGRQGEDEIGDKEGQDENVAPLGICSGCN